MTLSHAFAILHTHSQLRYKNPFYIPAQVTPFPAYPVLQVHVKLPSLLAQVARVLEHPPLFVAHSSTSAAKTKNLKFVVRQNRHR